MQNIVRNVGSAGEEKMNEAKTESAEGEARPAYARTLRWGNVREVRDLMQDLEIGYFDIVLGADLIYPEGVSVGEWETIRRHVSFAVCFVCLVVVFSSQLLIVRLFLVRCSLSFVGRCVVFSVFSRLFSLSRRKSASNSKKSRLLPFLV